MPNRDSKYEVFCHWCGWVSTQTITARNEKEAKEDFIEEHERCKDGISRNKRPLFGADVSAIELRSN
jgi:hypothetical protein